MIGTDTACVTTVAVVGVWSVDEVAFVLCGYVTEPCTNVEDLVCGPSLIFGFSIGRDVFVGFGAWTDSGAVVGLAALGSPDLSTVKSTAIGVMCEEVSVWVVCVSVEPCTDGAVLASFPYCVATVVFEPWVEEGGPVAYICRTEMDPVDWSVVSVGYDCAIFVLVVLSPCPVAETDGCCAETGSFVGTSVVVLVGMVVLEMLVEVVEDATMVLAVGMS